MMGQSQGIVVRLPADLFEHVGDGVAKDATTGVSVTIDDDDPTTAIVILPGRWVREDTWSDEKQVEVALRVAPYSDTDTVVSALAAARASATAQTSRSLVVSVSLSDVAPLMQVEMEALDALHRLRTS